MTIPYDRDVVSTIEAASRHLVNHGHHVSRV